MSKGAAHPEGVRYFGYAKQSSKGKYQPDSVNTGQATTEFISGSHPAVTLSAGGSAKIAGVRQHSGKENHVKVRHLNADHGGPAKKAGADARPAGVRVFKDAAV